MEKLATEVKVGDYRQGPFGSPSEVLEIREDGAVKVTAGMVLTWRPCALVATWPLVPKPTAEEVRATSCDSPGTTSGQAAPTKPEATAGSAFSHVAVVQVCSACNGTGNAKPLPERPPGVAGVVLVVCNECQGRGGKQLFVPLADFTKALGL